MDNVQIPPWNINISGYRGTNRKNFSIIICLKIFHIDEDINNDIRDEFNPFFTWKTCTTLHSVLIELHVRYAIHQQPSYTILSLINCDFVAILVERIGGCKSRGTTPDNGYCHARTKLGNSRTSPTFIPGTFNDRVFNVLDRHWTVNKTSNACTLIRCRTNPVSELWKVVCLMQSVYGIAPLIFVHEFIPFRNKIIHKASSMTLARRRSTVHAASSLNRALYLIVLSYIIVDLGQVERFF